MGRDARQRNGNQRVSGLPCYSYCRHAERIFQLAVFAVRSVLYEARDVELVDSDWDRFDLDVPAVKSMRKTVTTTV
jgi:hypothetical protein